MGQYEYRSLFSCGSEHTNLLPFSLFIHICFSESYLKEMCCSHSRGKNSDHFPWMIARSLGRDEDKRSQLNLCQDDIM